jgi:hypothetical protein
MGSSSNPPRISYSGGDEIDADGLSSVDSIINDQQLANEVLFWKPARGFRSQWAPARTGALLARLVGWSAADGSWLCSLKPCVTCT